MKHVKQEANKSETASDVVNSRVRKHSADQKTKPIVQVCVDFHCKWLAHRIMSDLKGSQEYLY